MQTAKWQHLQRYIQRTFSMPGAFRQPVNRAIGLYTLLRLPEVVYYQPEQVKIETTTRCNLACRFCGHTWGAARGLGLEHLPEDDEANKSLLNICRRAGRHMDLASFQRIIEQFPNMTRLDIQGMGEPLMNPDFPSFLELGVERNIQVQFFTNATLLTRSLAQKIVQANVSEVSISLDGVTAQSYEMVRQGAQFEKVVENIRNFCEIRRQAGSRKPIIRLALVVTSFNVGELPQLVELAHNLGADQVVATQFKCISQNLASWVCERGALAAAVGSARRKSLELSVPFKIEFALDPPPSQAASPASAPASLRRAKNTCFWPWFSINIDINGNLTPCAYVPCNEGWELGNLLERPFKEIWNADSYKHLRRKLKMGNMQDIFCAFCIDK